MVNSRMTCSLVFITLYLLFFSFQQPTNAQEKDLALYGQIKSLLPT